MSRDASKAMRPIVQAHEYIHKKNTDNATAELEYALGLIATIKRYAPTVKVKDQLWVAGTKLSIEETLIRKLDMVPIYNSLEEIQDLLPVEAARDHLIKAETFLQANDRGRARQELGLASDNLVYIETDIPLAHTEKYLKEALAYLAKNESERAGESLNSAERGLQFIIVDI